MKKFSILVLLIGNSILIFPQIANSSFENWNSGNPVSWFTSNYPEFDPTVVNITQTTNSQDGLFAIRGEVVEANLFGTTITYRPGVYSYDIEGTVLGFPIEDKPFKLKGYFIYEPVTEGEYLSINVYLTKYLGNGNRLVVATGGNIIANTAFLDSVYTEFVASINYFYPDQPDTVSISFEIAGSENSLGSVFYMDNLSLDFLEIIEPQEGEIVIASEKDTILWSASGENINLLYSTDNGNSFTDLLTNYPADSGRFVWEVPEELISAKSIIRIENSSDPSQKFDQSVSIKPYIITKFDQDENYIAYDIDTDRWGFSNIRSDMWPLTWYSQFNYQGTDPFTGLQYSQTQAAATFSSSRSLRHSDWVSWVNTFGTDTVYRSLLLGIYRPASVFRWRSTSGGWGGSCFGIAAANALAFAYSDQFIQKYPNFPSFINPISVVSDTGVKRVSNELYTHQFGNPSIANDALSNSKTPNQTLNELKALFKTHVTPVKTLTIFNNGGSGGHTILAYKLKREPNQDSIYYVYVYDNSNPNSTNPITINTSGNGGNGIWSTPDWPGWGGNRGMYLEIFSNQYLNGASPRFSNNQSLLILPDSVLEIHYPSNSQITVEDLAGNVSGYFNEILVNEIPGSRPMMRKNGSESPPYGYSLIVDNYAIVLDEFESDTVEAFFYTGNKSYVYERTGANQLETDRLFFDNGLSAVTDDQNLKTVSLINLITEDIQDKLTVLRSIELAQNDSVKIENPDINKVKLISYGSAKDYDIELNYVTENGIGRFGDFDVPLAANTSHTFVPDWTEINNTDLMVLADNGNNGTIDDTLYLQNQATDIEDEGSLIPSKYNLGQNYPNPFNPATTITFDIPEQGLAVLKVYNILGQEIATLVNEVRAAGRYSEIFDASFLPTGVYLYKLIVGSHTETKKMILIK